MIDRRTAGRARSSVAFVLGLVLALVACTDGASPDEELRASVRDTVAEAFRFTLTARADRAALDALGDDAVAAAEFLAAANLAGAHDPDVGFQLSATLAGDDPLLELVSTEGSGLYLRTGLGGLLGLEGRDPSDALGPALERAGIDGPGRDALVASFGGGWIELTDVDGLGELIASGAGEDGAGAVGAVADGGAGAGGAVADLDTVLDELEVTAVRDAGEVRRFDAAVAAGRLAAAAGLETSVGTLPVTVDVQAGRVREVRFVVSGGDLEAGSGTDGDAGVVELVLRIEPADGEDPVVVVPDPAAALPAADLLELVERLRTATTGAGP